MSNPVFWEKKIFQAVSAKNFIQSVKSPVKENGYFSGGGNSYPYCFGSLEVFGKKVYSIKGKNLLLRGANSLLLEQTLFQKRLDVQESKQGLTKVLP